MNKTAVIYHSADFDGIFCREIARKFLPDAELIGWNFGDAPLAIPPEGTIYVLDLPVDRVFGFDYAKELGQASTSEVREESEIQKMERRLIWIDHHKTSIDSHPRSIPGYRIDGVAACRLAWQWFQNYKEWDGGQEGPHFPTKQEFVERKVGEPLAVRLAGEYDIWDKRDPDADLFQHGLRSQPLGLEQWSALLEFGEHAERGVRILLERGSAIAYAKANENESVIRKNGFTIRWQGLTFLCCNHGQYNSHLFTAGIRPEHDALLGFCLRSNLKWSVSLYGVPGKLDVDLSEIAKRHGGGGHKQACGFTCDHLPFGISHAVAP